jgi:hypothetical protein
MGRGFAKPVGWVERPAYARYASFDGFKSAEARSAKAEAIPLIGQRGRVMRFAKAQPILPRWPATVVFLGRFVLR